MLRERWTIEQIEEWLEQTKLENRSFQEATALQLLKQLESGEETKEGNQLTSELYARLAESRSSKIKGTDHLSSDWTSKALTFDKTNETAHCLRLKEIIHYARDLPIPMKFPSIRETDHGSAKKKTAEIYHQIAEQFFQLDEVMSSYFEEAKLSLDFINDTELEDFIYTLNKSYETFHEPFKTIERTTKEYANSLTGVYYSQAQFSQIQKAVQEIEDAKQEWEELLTAFSPKRETLSALDELDSMIGLEDVKRRISKLYQFLHYQKARKEQGFRFKDELSLHMILTGNPGTGKTRLARLMATIYYELGLLERPEVYEVDRSQLVGGYVGQTEEQTTQAIERALGGVLFIDEAYSLKREGQTGQDYGQAAIDTLVSAMTGKHQGKFAVILAGYPEEMRSFLRGNPGLRSRFPDQNQVHILNYSTEELIEMAKVVASENDYVISDEAFAALEERIETEQVDESFGNGRTVKNIMLDAIFHKGSSTILEHATSNDFLILEADDFRTEESKERAEINNPIQELFELVGLDAAKQEIERLTSFVHVQKLRREHQLETSPLHLHAIFTGNPGTGKTTVARMYAKALHKLGLLKRGHLVEVSRADLVAGYVGQTAIKTKEKVVDALGGVLFIDEAYSLMSSNESDFGAEALATIVQEITKHNENLVVIMAGYKEEMKQLIQVNPGLYSRFKHEVPFSDYTQSELIDILLSRADKMGYRLDSKARERLNALIPTNGHEGNGRFVVGLLELMIQAQASRLSEIDPAQLDVNMLQTITKEDLLTIEKNLEG
ncbi:AAA family ATPase [Bacillus sp. FJAT-45037]|uniref:AAA family ATPase n=1 Tax=Bacillus sp. FJAT-45037 TaxID=2011007 RepID=UPI000C2490C2|nr:AAA family ATPase [Bacillus sp. FJAT-45037]